jgi:hypothetical protein
MNEDEGDTSGGWILELLRLGEDTGCNYERVQVYPTVFYFPSNKWASFGILRRAIIFLGSWLLMHVAQKNGSARQVTRVT